MYADIKNLPSISIMDTQCIWLGAKLNDIIEIERLSESTGLSMYYRIVIL
jgi:DNA-directed RNA polymerase subunit H (RpoH/RPB5)